MGGIEPTKGRRFPHAKPGEASILAPMMEQIRGQEPVTEADTSGRSKNSVS